MDPRCEAAGTASRGAREESLRRRRCLANSCSAIAACVLAARACVLAAKTRSSRSQRIGFVSQLNARTHKEIAVNLHQLVSDLIVDTKGSPDASFLSIVPDSSLYAFLPELIICATILLMLLVRLFEIGRKVNTGYIALAGSLVALYFAAPGNLLSLPTADSVATPTDTVRMEIFTGMLVYDAFSVFVRA